MIKPCGHKVIVKPDEVDKTSDGGIILVVDEKMEKSGIQRGTLVSHGPQAWKAFSNDFTGEPWANTGDYVLFARFAGKFIQDPFTKEEFLIMNDEDVLAIMSEETENV